MKVNTFSVNITENSSIVYKLIKVILQYSNFINKGNKVNFVPILSNFILVCAEGDKNV